MDPSNNYLDPNGSNPYKLNHYKRSEEIYHARALSPVN